MHSLKQELNILNNAISPYSNKYVGVVCCVWCWFVFVVFFWCKNQHVSFYLWLKKKGYGVWKKCMKQLGILECKGEIRIGKEVVIVLYCCWYKTLAYRLRKQDACGVTADDMRGQKNRMEHRRQSWCGTRLAMMEWKAGLGWGQNWRKLVARMRHLLNKMKWKGQSCVDLGAEKFR